METGNYTVALTLLKLGRSRRNLKRRCHRYSWWKEYRSNPTAVIVPADTVVDRQLHQRSIQSRRGIPASAERLNQVQP